MSDLIVAYAASTIEPRFDYRKILKEYIEYVGNCEGVSFLDYHEKLLGNLTAEETAELYKVDAELR